MFVGVLILGFTTFTLQAAEVSKKVKDQAVSLFGEQAKRHFESEVKQIKPMTISKSLEDFCKSYRFFLVGIPVNEKKVPVGTPGIIFYKMASAGNAFPLNNAQEIAAFLLTLKKPISNEKDVLERVNVFAEMLGATITTHMPKKKSIIKKYMEQKLEDWKLVISGTESGWKAHVTLMTDKAIEYCIRYELEFTRKGNMSVLKEKDIYSYTLYE
jgi:hypothetical protein